MSFVLWWHRAAIQNMNHNYYICQARWRKFIAPLGTACNGSPGAVLKCCQWAHFTTTQGLLPSQCWEASQPPQYWPANDIVLSGVGGQLQQLCFCVQAKVCSMKTLHFNSLTLSSAMFLDSSSCYAVSSFPQFIACSVLQLYCMCCAANWTLSDLVVSSSSTVSWSILDCLVIGFP